ncbi:MAG: hypothetical protein HZB53_19960 [Chloroflexi bacterium]|nr:hypothetical protein [Chloroflexota bacterium]
MSQDHAAHESAKPATPQSPDPTEQSSGPAAVGLGFDPRADVPRSVQRSRLIAMQGVVGNRAVQRLVQSRTPIAVQRDGGTPPASGTPAPAGGAPAPAGGSPSPTPATGLDASMLTFTGGDLKLAGNVSAAPQGDKVRVTAPDVNFSAHVTLNKDVTLGDNQNIETGPIQALMGADRIGVYRKGGDPTGEVLEEKHISADKTRDAAGEYDPRKGTVSGATYAPWFSQPKFLGDGNREADVSFTDRPGFSLDVKSGEGSLTEVKGQDRFSLSLAAKRAAAIIHLKSTNWEVPWHTAISPTLTGTGGSATSSVATEPPPVFDANQPIAILSAQQWSAFDTVEKAMAAPVSTLLRSLPAAKGQSPDAHKNIVDALQRKNPTLTITVTVQSTNSIAFDDRISVQVKGTKTAKKGSVVIGDGGSGTFAFGLTEVLDPASIDAGTTLSIEILEGMVWDSSEATGTLPFPFAGDIGLRKKGSAKYGASASI